MYINPIYKRIKNERRQYRKYAPWIFYISELILVFEILYSVDLFVNLGNSFLMVMIAVGYLRFIKLIDILERQKKLK